MKKIHIKDKFKEMGVDLEDFILGDFDMIGEYTARKARSRDSDHYKHSGAFFRPNYERGMLIYSLIKKYKVESFLEIGFGRGYGTFCAAMAMQEIDKGKIVTVDPNINQNHITHLRQVFPKEWFDRISFMSGTSQEILPTLLEEFDFVYIDGDHTYNGVKYDWENTKDKFNKFLLFDDYHLPSKKNDGYSSKDIECAKLIDEIDDKTKQLIIMDRRIFFDDRKIPDKQIDYGQVLLTKL